MAPRPRTPNSKLSATRTPSQVLEGHYNSTVGDRLKVKNTFRPVQSDSRFAHRKSELDWEIPLALSQSVIHFRRTIQHEGMEESARSLMLASGGYRCLLCAASILVLGGYRMFRFSDIVVPAFTSSRRTRISG